MLSYFRNLAAIILGLYICLKFATAALASAACVITNDGTVGATVRFFNYIWNGTRTFPKYNGTVTGVLDLKWDSGQKVTNPSYGYVGVPISDFLMEISGYYKAPLTGIYTLTTKVDGFDTIFMGSGDALDHGVQEIGLGSGGRDFINTGNSVGGTNAVSRAIYMEAGYYYLFKAVYINFSGGGMLEMTMNWPNGTVDSSIVNNLYSIPDASFTNRSAISFAYSGLTAHKTITSTKTVTLSGLSTATSSFTTTTTSTINRFNEEVMVIYGEAVLALVMITTYIPSLVASSSVFSTYTSYTTDSKGNSSPIGIVVVVIPVQSTVTVYTTGIVGATSALSSYISYTTDSNGSTKVICVIVVEISKPNPITSYIPGLVTSVSVQCTTTSLIQMVVAAQLTLL